MCLDLPNQIFSDIPWRRISFSLGKSDKRKSEDEKWEKSSLKGTTVEPVILTMKKEYLKLNMVGILF